MTRSRMHAFAFSPRMAAAPNSPPKDTSRARPDLIVEVAAGGGSFDLGAKLNAYRRNGVREYVVQRTYDGEVDWFVLRDGNYEKLKTDDQGIYRSEIFPGLWLKVDALIAERIADVLAVLQSGIAQRARRFRQRNWNLTASQPKGDIALTRTGTNHATNHHRRRRAERAGRPQRQPSPCRRAADCSTAQSASAWLRSGRLSRVRADRILPTLVDRK